MCGTAKVFGMKNPNLKLWELKLPEVLPPQLLDTNSKNVLDLFLPRTNQQSKNYIVEVKAIFYKTAPEDVAFPRGVSNLEKYSSVTDIYSKGTPVAVKGSLIYNHYLKKTWYF